MSTWIVTLDIDWACEAAIEQTLESFEALSIRPTIFTTHPSSVVEKAMSFLEVGLHPYFGPDSSQGTSIAQVVNYVCHLPHNLAAFRCHRFASDNASKQAMLEAGMLISSNVCTDLQIVAPFKDRYGLLEVPIFMEDGGYLWRKHPLIMTRALETKIQEKGLHVLLIHPMHFVLNTPHFGYMLDIKQSFNRQQWNQMSAKELHQLRWKGRGIRDLLIEILQMAPQYTTLGTLLTAQENSVISI